jgi:hypothetical protein
MIEAESDQASIGVSNLPLRLPHALHRLDVVHPSCLGKRRHDCAIVGRSTTIRGALMANDEHVRQRRARTVRELQDQRGDSVAETSSPHERRVS